MTKLKVGVAVLAMVLAGCSVRKFYDGPERDEVELVRLQAENSYFFSVDGRSTHAAQEGPAPLLVLPGTHKVIVQLDEERAATYGRVGVPFILCTVIGHRYTVFPVTNVPSRTWEPAARDDTTGRSVPRGPCGGDEAPVSDEPVATRVPPPAPPVVVAPPPAPPAATPPPAPPAATPPPAPAPAASPPPAAAAPAPTPPTTATVPATAAPADALAAGAQVRLIVPARTRAIVDAPAAKGLDAGATVTLKVRMKKDTGVWWYVKGDAGAGWVLESELGEPAAQ